MLQGELQREVKGCGSGGGCVGRTCRVDDAFMPSSTFTTFAVML